MRKRVQAGPNVRFAFPFFLVHHEALEPITMIFASSLPLASSERDLRRRLLPVDKRTSRPYSTGENAAASQFRSGPAPPAGCGTWRRAPAVQRHRKADHVLRITRLLLLARFVEVAPRASFPVPGVVHAGSTLVRRETQPKSPAGSRRPTRECCFKWLRDLSPSQCWQEDVGSKLLSRPGCSCADSAA